MSTDTRALAQVVVLQAKPERTEDLRAALEVVRHHVNDEPGTLQWTLHVSAQDPDTIVIYEVYVDQAAAEAHGLNPGLVAVFPELDSMLRAPLDIRKLIVDPAAGPRP